jgi:hypothetical protein
MTIRVLVLGEPECRARVVDLLESAEDLELSECDPALGDCVMFVRLEGGRFDAFVMLGYEDPATRGALAIVAERTVLVPLVGDQRAPDPAGEAYLFRLPAALGFRTEHERGLVTAIFPDAANVPASTVGTDVDDLESLHGLLTAMSDGRWRWADFRPASDAGSRPTR